jgi:hypothetical protein
MNYTKKIAKAFIPNKQSIKCSIKFGTAMLALMAIAVVPALALGGTAALANLLPMPTTVLGASAFAAAMYYGTSVCVRGIEEFGGVKYEDEATEQNTELKGEQVTQQFKQELKTKTDKAKNIYKKNSTRNLNKQAQNNNDIEF